jgi:hypothetical protein
VLKGEGMDPFEEFEFKPLTEGLGFHKKKSQSPSLNLNDSGTSAFSKDLIKNKGLELIDETEGDLRPPLPRKKTNPGVNPSGTKSEKNQAVDDILKTLQKNRRFDFENIPQKNLSTTNAKESFKSSAFNLSAALLDGMLILAASLLCMIIVLVITKVDLIANLSHPDSEGLIYAATGAMVACVSFIYLTLNRIYIGWTPGEWAFDQRIGKPEELDSSIFSLKVIARSSLVIATGFALLPILSFVFNKDIAGSITGARRYKKA